METQLDKRKRNLPENLKHLNPYNVTNQYIPDLETHNELIKRMKDDGITNMLYKIRGYSDDNKYIHSNCWYGYVGCGGNNLIEINGMIYTNDTIWSENKNEYSEIIWYNVAGLSDLLLPEFIYYNSFMSENESGPDFISINEKEFGELMKKRITLTDEQQKSPVNSEPELFPMIKNLGYTETKKQIEMGIKELQETLKKLSFYKNYERLDYSKKQWKVKVVGE